MLGQCCSNAISNVFGLLLTCKYMLGQCCSNANSNAEGLPAEAVEHD